MTNQDIVVRRLTALAPLDDASIEALSAATDTRGLRSGEEIVDEHEALRPRFLVSGWAARVRWLADGRRQILGFLLPGEGIGLCARPQPLALSPLTAVTPVELRDASMAAQMAFGRDTGGALATALHISAALDEAALLDQIVRLGRQNAIERLAHLFLELRFRLDLVGLVESDAFALPLTQDQLADATGLSAVHVNRSLQQLRRDELIELKGGRLRLLRRGMLETIADYRRPEVTRWAPKSRPSE